MYRRLVKPLLDWFVALMLIVVTLPVQLIVAFLLLIFNHGKVFFLQERPGKGEQPFRVIKFRTMNDRRGDDGVLLPDRDRLTAWGKFLRKTSIDELPQLVNILKGEMSFVGPRPLLMEYLPLYNSGQRRRHEVRPGITGWAQVNGRNALSWQKKFELDGWYVDHCSFMTDLKILFLTFIRVIRAEGISAEGSATMEKFNGNS